MDAGTIVLIAVGAVVVLCLAVLIGRFARRRRELHRLERRRGEAVDHHRREAEVRHARADLASQRAEAERAEAELQDKRAELHERGLADEQLADDELARGREPEEALERDGRVTSSR